MSVNTRLSDRACENYLEAIRMYFETDENFDISDIQLMAVKIANLET